MSFHYVLLLGIFLAHFAVIGRAIMVEGRDPYARLAWVMALSLFPILGIVAYAMFGEPWMSDRFRRKANRVFKQLEQLPSAAARESVPLGRVPEYFVGSFRTCEALSLWIGVQRGTPSYYGLSV